MALAVTLNGKPRIFETLGDGATLNACVAELGVKPDRIAIEHNGEIVPRRRWGEDAVREGDKLEMVHFVGGGLRCVGA